MGQSAIRCKHLTQERCQLNRSKLKEEQLRNDVFAKYSDLDLLSKTVLRMRIHKQIRTNLDSWRIFSEPVNHVISQPITISQIAAQWMTQIILQADLG